MIRVFTAFSGYDSQCLALDRLVWARANEIESAGLHGVGMQPFAYGLVGWSEIDKHAISAHNAIYPQWARTEITSKQLTLF